MKAIYGLYSDSESAQRAVQLDLAARDVAVLSSEPLRQFDFGTQQERTIMPWLAALGGFLGGAGGYALASFSQKLYPILTGGMPIVSPWTNGIITYETAALGAILVNLVTLLSSARFPDWRAKLYDPEISRGNILVGVTNPPEDSRQEIEARLREAGAKEVRQFPPAAPHALP